LIYSAFATIAKAYAEWPEQTLVVSPDNRPRQEINERIHRELQSNGRVEEQEQQLTVLVPRQEMTGADRQWAAQYEAGDIVRYSRGSQAPSVEGGEYVRVIGVDRDENLLTVERANGQHLTYDPDRLHGVSVYRERPQNGPRLRPREAAVPAEAMHTTEEESGTEEASQSAEVEREEQHGMAMED